jgi:hypothetical protein
MQGRRRRHDGDLTRRLADDRNGPRLAHAVCIPSRRDPRSRGDVGRDETLTRSDHIIYNLYICTGQRGRPALISLTAFPAPTRHSNPSSRSGRREGSPGGTGRPRPLLPSASRLVLRLRLRWTLMVGPHDLAAGSAVWVARSLHVSDPPSGRWFGDARLVQGPTRPRRPGRQRPVTCPRTVGCLDAELVFEGAEAHATSWRWTSFRCDRSRAVIAPARVDGPREGGGPTSEALIEGSCCYDYIQVI